MEVKAKKQLRAREPKCPWLQLSLHTAGTRSHIRLRSQRFKSVLRPPLESRRGPVEGLAWAQRRGCPLRGNQAQRRRLRAGFQGRRWSVQGIPPPWTAAAVAP